MKKILLFSLLFFIGINYVYASTDTAYSYVLMDEVTGRVLKGKNIDSPKLIASITKIMTCILAIEANKLDDVVVVNESVLSSYGSGIYISVGEEIKLIDLLYGLMLRSGNDAALMIADYVGGDVDNFVVMMNKKAKEVGMKNTKFVNPSGLDKNGIGNYSTSYDMALLTRYAMQNDIYREIVKTKSYVAKSNLKTYVWKNKNKLLNYKYITGGKTGFTETARRTLVSTATYDGMNFIVVTIRDSDDWNTHLDLYESAFKNYKNYLVLSKKNYIVLEDKYYDNLYIKNDLYIPLTKNEATSLISHVKLERIRNYDNTLVGHNYIYLRDKKIYDMPVYAKKNKDKVTFWSKIKGLFR